MTAIQATNLGKAYRQYAKPSDSLKEMILRRPYHSTFWALREVGFVLDEGQSLGVIGDNGAGKSTLLKLLAGTLRRSTGDLKIKGRVSAILELGSGFHPEFSGLENARIGCAMLGMKESDVTTLIPEIVAFSELEEFIERPVKTYSSGMYVRLAFSVITSVNPDILVVDEALSVGDAHFQKKCMDRMRLFREQGRGLVFCSHNLYQVKELCESAIWLHKGRVRMSGDSAKVVDAYQDYTRQRDAPATPGPGTQAKPDAPASATPPQPHSPASILDASLSGYDEEDAVPLFRTHNPFRVRVTARAPGLPLGDVHLGIVITRNDGIQCYGVSTIIDDQQFGKLDEGDLGIDYVLERLPLLSGEYALEVWLIDASGVHVYDSRNPCCRFRVRQQSSEVGVAWLPHRWERP